MRSSQFKPGKKTLIALLIIAILAVLAGVFHFGPFHKPAVVASGAAFTTKGEAGTSRSSSSSSNASQNSSQGTTASTIDKSTVSPTAILYTPSGDFVSNHHPNLSGSPAPNTMASVCNTTPGGKCTIAFTKDGVTKSLSVQTADANGSAYWYWKLQDIGLGSGTWKIQATASLNGQSKTASDPMDLVVTQ